MRDLKNKLTLSKNSRNIQSKRTKGFGYQILGFGGGVAGAGPVSVDYLVVAGGGGGGHDDGGGGGAGGYKESAGTSTGSYTVSPLGSGVAALDVTPGPYSITVGGGGTGAPNSPIVQATNGEDSVFSSITSTGGGFGGRSPQAAGQPGGSGGAGGGGSAAAGGSASPPGQGSAGGAATPVSNAGGGGGGATAVGGDGSGSAPGGAAGPGGAGATSNITNSPTG